MKIRYTVAAGLLIGILVAAIGCSSLCSIPGLSSLDSSCAASPTAVPTPVPVPVPGGNTQVQCLLQAAQACMLTSGGVQATFEACMVAAAPQCAVSMSQAAAAFQK